MKNLNAEVCEICGCMYAVNKPHICYKENYHVPKLNLPKDLAREITLKNTITLITSQEQRIKELTAKNEAQDIVITELRKLLEKANHDADRYARKIKELIEENERLKLDVEVCGAELSRYTENIVQMAKQDRADTVRKMSEKLKAYFGTYFLGYKIPISEALKALNQTSKEILGEEICQR